MNRSDAERSMKEVLEALDLYDENDPNISDTPRRFIGYLLELTEDHRESVPVTQLAGKSFPARGKCDGIVAVSNIEFSSICSHHLLPFSGLAHVAYIGGDELIGLSKVARIVEKYAHKLQLQEVMTEDIAGAFRYLGHEGVLVLTESRHQCMVCRGVKQRGAVASYASVRGRMLMNPDLRDEAYRMIERAREVSRV